MVQQGHTSSGRAPQKNGDAVSGAEQLSGPDRQMFENICGDLQIRIARDGTWFYRNSPIGRKRLVKLFSTVLRRDAEGDFWLVTPVEQGKIEVEDAPFVAVEVWAEGSGPDQVISVRTNLDDIVVIDGDHPLRVETDPESFEPRPYVMIRDGLEALVARSVFYHLVEMAEERDGPGGAELGIRSSGEFFSLGKLEPGATAGTAN